MNIEDNPLRGGLNMFCVWRIENIVMSKVRADFLALNIFAIITIL